MQSVSHLRHHLTKLEIKTYRICIVRQQAPKSRSPHSARANGFQAVDSQKIEDRDRAAQKASGVSFSCELAGQLFDTFA